MGFGILFLGYVCTYLFSMTPFGIFTDVLGNLVLLYALRQLGQYNRFFRLSMYAAGALALCASANAALTVFAVDNAVLAVCLNVAKVVCVCFFHVTLLRGVGTIAADTGLLKLQKKAMRNMSLTILYIALSLFLMLPFPDTVAAELNLYVTLPVFILGLLWLVLNAVLLFSCYMWICLEGDEDMEVRESKFSIVNRVQRKFSDMEDGAFLQKKRGQSAAEAEPPQTSRSSKKKKKKK